MGKPSDQIIFQELADRFKKLEGSFAELKGEIKAKLKELQQKKTSAL